MTFFQIWLIGWVVTTLILSFGTVFTNWEDSTKSKFLLAIAITGIVLWPAFVAIVVGFTFGLFIKGKQ